MSVASHFIRALTSPLKYHIYVSRSQNVAVNLSIEHYLFQKSHAESTILFLYVNKPCIVIGRNQNPWLEVNHALVRQSTVPIGPSDHLEEGKSPEKAKVEIIRRRSGGGTVFHDLGNVNFSVICPPATFNRDQHAEMVVQAIRETNPRARVNQRHDIVLDPGPLLDKGDCPDPDDTHRSRFTFGDGPLVPRKVSGSAYKLVRQRALHHGTCLFNSPNVSSISEYLRSPARLFLKARGVESVRSPIANISGQTSQSPSLTTHVLQRQIIEAFIQKYNLDVIDTHHFLGLNTLVARLEEKDGYASGVVDDHLLEVPEIAAGKREIEVNGHQNLVVSTLIRSFLTTQSLLRIFTAKHRNSYCRRIYVKKTTGLDHRYPHGSLPQYVWNLVSAKEPLRLAADE